ncbi:MAG: hypothetical protein ACFB00_01505 [Parvularculaceae bacterium]
MNDAGALGDEPGGSGVSVARRYVRLPGSIDDPFLMIEYGGACGSSGCERWLQGDLRGSIVSSADETGAAREIYAYAPYGAPADGPGGVPFRFGRRRRPRCG